jgi:hypothetical protein
MIICAQAHSSLCQPAQSVFPYTETKEIIPKMVAMTTSEAYHSLCYCISLQKLVAYVNQPKVLLPILIPRKSPYSLVTNYQRFGRTYCFQLHAFCSEEMFAVTYQTIRRHSPENHNVSLHCCET